MASWQTVVFTYAERIICRFEYNEGRIRTRKSVFKASKMALVALSFNLLKPTGYEMHQQV